MISLHASMERSLFQTVQALSMRVSVTSSPDFDDEPSFSLQSSASAFELIFFVLDILLLQLVGDDLHDALWCCWEHGIE